jgi:hypothetical protein
MLLLGCDLVFTSTALRRWNWTLGPAAACAIGGFDRSQWQEATTSIV